MPGSVQISAISVKKSSSLRALNTQELTHQDQNIS